MTESELNRAMPEEYAAKLREARTSDSMLGERRVVTILFCDVTGSVAMAGELDPEDWAEIMDDAFERIIPPIYRYEGTVARLMGDGVLAFFGAPISHEDDPQRAVMAGLEMLEQIEEFSIQPNPDNNRSNTNATCSVEPDNWVLINSGDTSPRYRSVMNCAYDWSEISGHCSIHNKDRLG